MPLALFLLGTVTACGDEPTSNAVDASPDAPDDTAASPLIGSYEVSSITNDDDEGLFREETKWLQFNADNVFMGFWQKSKGYRGITRELFLATPTQVVINYAIYNYTLEGDRLVIENFDTRIEATRSTSSPSEDMWAPMMSITQQVMVDEPDAYDLEWDGGAFWYSTYEELRRVSFPTGEVLDTLPTNSARALGWDGTNLWVSYNGYDTLNRVDLDTGNRIFTSASVGAWPYSMAWDGSHFWVYSSSEQALVRYDPAANSAVETIPREDLGTTWLGGIAIWNGELWLSAEGGIHRCTLAPFAVVASYQVDGAYAEGLATDGTALYAFTRKLGVYSISRLAISP
ncbi:MAG: hypothetical protein SFX73_21265 [Kofleriaceae bacterium]|nr:hypothetical protein [Kofleriaceae bacterium]